MVIKRMFILTKPHLKRVILAGIMGLGVSSINGTLAYLMKPVIDDILIKKDFGLLIVIPLAIIVLFTLRGFFIAGQSYLMKSTGMKIVNTLRNDLYRNLFMIPLSGIREKTSGNIISRFINDINLLQSLIATSLKDLFVEGFTVIILLGFAFYKRWDLTLFVVIVVPLAIYGLQKLSRKVKEASLRAQQKISIITEALSETLNGMKIIKVFGKEEDLHKRFKDRNQSYYREIMRVTRLIEGTSLFMEMIGGLAIAFVIWSGGGFVIKGLMTPGDLASFVVALMMIHTPAKRLARVNNDIQQARSAFLRIDELFNMKKEKSGIHILREFNDSIEFRNVYFLYPGTKNYVLEDINLIIKRGEIVALVGRSGVGKTTLVDLITRFYDPTEGNILIDKKDLRDCELKSLRNLFGIVSQDIILFNDTVNNNILFAKPDATMEEVINAAISAHAHEFITEFPEGYDTIIGERGTRLSGGQAQRIAIARALLKDPPILILDEATSSLDTQSEFYVQKALDNLMRNRTTIIIAHRLSTVRRASRIIVLEGKRIVETGTHDELMELNGIYRRLYEHQMQ